MSQGNTLEDFITDILDGKDTFMTSLSLKYKSRFLTMIQTMDLNPNIFSINLKTIADELFSKDGNNDPYITSLLLFSIELNQFCTLNYSWYKKDILVRELAKILNEKCQRMEYRSNCSILYLLTLFIHFPELVGLREGEE